MIAQPFDRVTTAKPLALFESTPDLYLILAFGPIPSIGQASWTKQPIFVPNSPALYHDLGIHIRCFENQVAALVHRERCSLVAACKCNWTTTSSTATWTKAFFLYASVVFLKGINGTISFGRFDLRKKLEHNHGRCGYVHD